jgi:hypothetical protein
MLEDAGGQCWRMLEDAGGCWRMLEDMGRCWRTMLDMLEDVGGCGRGYWFRQAICNDRLIIRRSHMPAILSKDCSRIKSYLYTPRPCAILSMWQKVKFYQFLMTLEFGVTVHHLTSYVTS